VNILVTAEQRYWRDAQGRIYTDNPPTYDFFKQFLDTFSSVTVLARVRDDASRSFPEVQRADGPRVKFASLPYFQGPAGFIRSFPRALSVAKLAVAESSALLLRVPGVAGELGILAANSLGKAYSVQVLGDPYEVFSSGANNSPFRGLYRAVFVRQTRRACQQAKCVAYVSGLVLTRRYPPNSVARQFVFSDVMLQGAILSQEGLSERCAALGAASGLLRLGTIGTLEANYKGIDVMLKALALSAKSLDFEYSVAGDGALKDGLKRMANQLGIGDRVRFLGQLRSRQEIFNFLDTLDLYVQPSRQEGMPRALLEAMARGCPAIATNVGGIPEILDQTYLAAPNDPQGLAAKLVEYGNARSKLSAMAEQNVRRARDFDEPHLLKIRSEFFAEVKRTAGGGSMAVSVGMNK